MLNRKFDFKPLMVFSMFLMAVCLSAFALARSEDWEVNPADFRYDMSLYFDVTPEQFGDLENYEIGAFVGDECRGLAQVIDLNEEKQCLYMRIRSNSVSDEEIQFRARDLRSGEIAVLKADSKDPFLFEADAMEGLPSKPVNFSAYYQITIGSSEHGSVTFENGLYLCGQEIELIAEPAVGYRFESWSDGETENPRKITVESNMELSAIFAISSYSLILNVDGELYEMRNLVYGDKIEMPEMPEREGYTFSGWGEVPETMPAHDVEVSGAYAVNFYMLSLTIDGNVYKTYPTAYGTPLNREDFEGSEAPEREGYTFMGWGEVPETMPAHDVELAAVYNINSYKLTLKLNGEEWQILTVIYGEKIDLPTPPEQEGSSFSGWGTDVPETMPAHDVELNGRYDFKGYKLTLIVDGEVYEMKTLLYGEKIELPEMPEREGYTFSGWSESPEKMPARDVEVKGEYEVNIYKLTLLIDGEVYKEEHIAYGTALKIDDPEPKEGYTFSGWGEVLKTMPAHDLELSGTYSINTYKIMLKIDEELFEVLNFEYGAKIELLDAPEKEGYTFSGWSEYPETMPAEDIEVTGSYIVNVYKLTVYVDGEIYIEEDVAFGTKLDIPDPEVPEGYEFSGWDIEIPETMPANDLVINGETGPTVGVERILEDMDSSCNVYDTDGHIVLRNATLQDVSKKLGKGIYIMNGKKFVNNNKQ